jgi:hypothetical protein
MDEARRVLARLERIEALQRAETPAASMLEELRALLHEAEAWARAEQNVPETALDAVARGRQMLKSTRRTLLA